MFSVIQCRLLIENVNLRSKNIEFILIYSTTFQFHKPNWTKFPPHLLLGGVSQPDHDSEYDGQNS